MTRSGCKGIAAYREIDREFAQGDRIQFTANNRELAVLEPRYGNH